MQAKKILFPTDFSTLSDAALDHATSLAKESGATLVILHVEEPPAAYGGGEMYYGIPDPDSDTLRIMLQKIAPRDPGIPCEYHLVMGNPADEIVRQADQTGCDLIVMGTHGRTGLRRLLMGSVAEAVVRQAHCPVVTYRLPDAQ
jgi:nucleotide-binding universal stress UspA family protein